MLPCPRAIALLLAAPLLACAAQAPQRSAQEVYVDSLREEHRAVTRLRAELTWYEATQGEEKLAAPLDESASLTAQSALTALERAQRASGIAAPDALALQFLRHALDAERVQLATAALDAQASATEADGTIALPFLARPLAYRDAPLILAQQADPARRAQLQAAISSFLEEKLNPILARKEQVAQAAARAEGYPDYVALCSALREVDLPALLVQGADYVRATEAPFRATLDRVAREELGIPREELRASDLARLWKAPRLAQFFPRSLELPALRFFLHGLGLSLRTATGSEILIDSATTPRKRPRAFVEPVDAPSDVRLSVKPSGGLDDYWALFHEAGHAVHFASATLAPEELRTLGFAAPAEAYGELFRSAFADTAFLLRYRDFLAAQGAPVPSDVQLAEILRHTALVEMMYLRRYAFAKIAWELRLHGRPLAEIGPALALLPDAALVRGQGEGALRELYRQLFSVASTVTLSTGDAERFRVDVDDGFYAADYARAFALAGMLHDGLRKKFGEGWTDEPAAGAFLRKRLFAAGMSLSAEEVAQRLGYAPRIDFAFAAARANRLLRAADELEHRELLTASATLAR